MSDQDTAESSDSQFSDSPYYSSSQQVPKLTSKFKSGLTCSENSGQPYLQIIEQPQEYFRFRYISEMVGTHGCLLGKSSGTSKVRTHPTVQLMNHNGRAVIRCSLVQHNNGNEHPHELLVDDQDQDVVKEVPEDGSYRISFIGMGIIHTAKKQVHNVLFKKMSQQLSDVPYDQAELRKRCADMAKQIELNIIRLKFSAHDVTTNAEICPPVYSEPIHNMKSAATNDLKICRYNISKGRPCGDDILFLLVEKVNKKNIEVRFYELNENNDVTWSAKARFRQTDVHHQYAIVCSTPPYRDVKIQSEVKVNVALVRPKDGKFSEPVEFTYVPERVHMLNKKRKAGSAFNSFSSFESSGNSIKSCDIPVSVRNQDDFHPMVSMNDITMYTPPHIPVLHTMESGNPLADALSSQVSQLTPLERCKNSDLMFSQTTQSDLPVLPLNDSTELNRILNNNMVSEEKKKFLDYNLIEYFKIYDSTDFDGHMPSMNSLEFQRLVPDSGRQSNPICQKAETKDQEQDVEYDAFYTPEDAKEVKNLIDEIATIIQKKRGYEKKVVRTKLERLCEIRLSNKDTFLHMALCHNMKSLDYILKLIESMKMSHLLNLKNDLGQTVLDVAVAKGMPQMVSELVTRGCDPMEKDLEGNTALHYAVIGQRCLKELLTAIRETKVSCDLNTYNNDKRTPLHLAVLYSSERSVRELLQNGASYNVRDEHGRTPLHLAAYGDCLPVLRALLDFIPCSEIDVPDGQDYTALQIVCSSDDKANTIEMAKLLLDKKADPLLVGSHGSSAWKLARSHEALRTELHGYLPSDLPGDAGWSVQVLLQDELKSEPEDEDASAEENDEVDELSPYVQELSAILDNNGSWRELAQRLHHDSLLNWYENTKSPTKTLLSQVKQSETTINSKSLAFILENMGQIQAASVIKKYLDK